MTSMKRIRPRLDRFVDIMREKLAVPANQQKEDWRVLDQACLRSMLADEIIELDSALRGGRPGKVVAREAADASNILMMIADLALLEDRRKRLGI